MIHANVILAALLFPRAHHSLLADEGSQSTATRPCAFERRGDMAPRIVGMGKRLFWHGPRESPSMPQEVSADLKPRFRLYPIKSWC